MKFSLSERSAELVLLSLTLIWGVSFPITRELVQSYSGLEVIAFRFSLSAVALFFVRPRELFSLTKKQKKIVLGLGTILWASYICQTLGLRYTTSARGGFITGLNVVIVPVIAMPLLKERLTSRKIFALILAVAGLATLAWDAGEASHIARATPADLSWGDSLVFLCAVLFSFHIVLINKYADELPPLAGTMGQMAVVGVLASVTLVFSEGFQHRFAVQLGNLLFLSLVGTAFVIFMQIKAQRYTDASKAGFIFSMEPVFATLFGWMLAGEKVTALTIVAGGMMIGAVTLSLWGAKRAVERLD